MTLANEIMPYVDDLAALWTELTLSILKGAGIRCIPVEMEIEAWRTLRLVLRTELRWQWAFRFSTLVSLGMLREQTLRKAALIVARKFEPRAVSHELESLISQLVGEQRSTGSERRLYSAIVRQPALKEAFKEPSLTDFVPRLRVSAGGG